MPEVLEKGTFIEQMTYIEERTRIYENYRAIREDLFQMIKKNSIDTVNRAKGEIAGLIDTRIILTSRIDSLNRGMADIRTQLDEMTRSRDAIKVFGMEVNKVTYNLVMIAIIIGLLTALVFGYMAYIRTRVITVATRKEHEELNGEFEKYRTEARESREKIVMEHFLEIKKLRGG
ncbi:MAG: hypothetical protein E4G95_02695 [Bacteroidia bacterium]|nr:MAG: hypothetical protein E4G95_02695 [Bacteroidia bacterium]